MTREIAYFIPADPLIRIGTKPSQLAAQSEDVLVDRRGGIYLSDKNHGIHILRLQNVWPYLNELKKTSAPIPKKCWNLSARIRQTI